VVEDRGDDDISDGHRWPADARDAAARQRDLAAEQRDGAGDERDRSGARRDVDAGRRDESDDALDVDARAGTTGSDLVVNLLDRSAQARADAATDRMHASTDRESGAGDRFHAARDRHAASTDREASSNDRRDAAKDHLTGVYERRSGFAELEREIARARRMGAPVVVAFFDVDGLKEVNDRFGHTAGDRMLVEFATMLTAHLRPYDLVMRYGGDEFVCVLPGMSSSDAQDRLAPLQTALRSAPEHGSASVGIAELDEGETADDVIARADAALYRARRERRPGEL